MSADAWVHAPAASEHLLCLHPPTHTDRQLLTCSASLQISEDDIVNVKTLGRGASSLVSSPIKS